MPKTLPPEEPETPFVLNNNELRLLSSGKCGATINVDTLDSIAQLNIKRKEFNLLSNKYDKKLCLNFTFQPDKFSLSKRIYLDVLPNYAYSSGGLLRHNTFVSATIFGKDTIEEVYGKGSFQQNLPSIKLYQYIKKLYLYSDSLSFGINEEDIKLMMRRKKVVFKFLIDSKQLIAPYLSQMVKGYVLAQRELCESRFHKPLKNASIKEIDTLATERPLLFKMVVARRQVNSAGITHFDFSPLPR